MKEETFPAFEDASAGYLDGLRRWSVPGVAYATGHSPFKTGTALSAGASATNVSSEELHVTFSRRYVFMLELIAVIVASGAGCAQERVDDARSRMVQDQIVSRGVQDSATLRAMHAVPRHLFVPDWLVSRAYDDAPLPIGQGQTISQPYIVALMTELVHPRRGQRVLEVGTGSGYQAAVLAEIVDTVFTIEIIPDLARSAAARLRDLGYRNVVVRQGDGYLGWAEHAPFDAILVTAAAEDIPGPLVDQLRDGGVMVIPVGPAEWVQSLTLVKKEGTKVVTESLVPVRFVPLTRER
jgi:protein-L-isoaspartate(D-aspartate) O-methyltransferase